MSFAIAEKSEDEGENVKARIVRVIKNSTRDEKFALTRRFKLMFVPCEVETADIEAEMSACLKADATTIKMTRRGMSEEYDVVFLDVLDDVAVKLEQMERVYVKWFSFPVYEVLAMVHCFRCLGDHLVVNCKQNAKTCRNCGEIGHIENWCSNDEKCRDCHLKKLDASHRMHSSRCPLYVAKLKKNNGN